MPRAVLVVQVDHCGRFIPPITGASRLVLAMSAWSVKTRRAPSRHCRDARVYGHTTTAVHDRSIHDPYRTGPLTRKPDKGPGLISYLSTGIFYTNVSITALQFLISSKISG